ncbi:TVP38/TMEM64 family protein [Calothrix sp. NIES-3974]|uniref:TVP38/TMEM64 family protein n=1 Tax=Calothrix sp. NIES-3974 TaxID=2005462 RepID=UPI000B5FFE41|nr:TVP38/TMEM64 family protein [Calothrix sp. NIES-3974]BAZ03883.1 DedA protein [Calothrix sp. NIES-3974]
MNHQSKPSGQSKLKLLLMAIAIAGMVVLSRQFDLQQLYQRGLITIQNWGVWAPIGYMAIYNLATLLFVPGSILTIKGGCLFGLFWGSVYVLIAATFGATFAFLIGRYFSRDWVHRQISRYPHFQAIDRAVGKEGFKIVLLTRLSPVFPFNLLNYIFGVTQVSLKDYIYASIGMVPGIILYVYIGTLVGNISTMNPQNLPTNTTAQIGQWLLQGIGLIAAIAITIYLSKIARQALKESMAESDTGVEN